MKILFLLLVCTLFIQTANSQTKKIDNKDLIGSWDIADTSGGKMTFTFTDSFRFILETPQTIRLGMKLGGTYSINANENVTFLTMISEEFGVKHTSYSPIRIIDKKTLKMQNLANDNSIIWETETKNNTAIFIRRE